METKIYCGKGTHISHSDYMDFIDMVFGFTTPEQKFIGLLPKLYREDRRPQDSNYIVTEDGRLVAAVGAYNHEITVCGIKIPCRGIGNVAVHPEARSKGYMKAAMNAALEDMIRDGVALSTLGGRRQRYQYFAYDKAGPCYTFSVVRDNIRHLYGDMDAPLTVKVIEDPKDSLIDSIMTIASAAPFVPTRTREDFLDIANSWHARLLAFLDSDRLVGYCIMAGNSVIEIRAGRDEDFMLMVRSISSFLDHGGYTIHLSPFDHAYVSALNLTAEHFSVEPSMSYNVLNYRLILNAFLKLKLTYAQLRDGEVTLLIHGFAGDERLRVTIKNAEVSVEKISDEISVDYEFSHLEATNVLFAPVSAIRDGMSPLMRDWFPLPLWMYRSDEV
ncbi:MAG: GNAT family N-acetyltransferase [Ruminococcaceae bacterium]|nr:GNAT family N-acetyltransferase [Oscillospiraceae bacterium]